MPIVLRTYCVTLAGRHRPSPSFCPRRGPQRLTCPVILKTLSLQRPPPIGCSQSAPLKPEPALKSHASGVPPTFSEGSAAGWELSSRCPAGGGAASCAVSLFLFPRTVWKRREAQGQWLAELGCVHVTVAGPISDTQSGSSWGGASLDFRELGV